PASTFDKGQGYGIPADLASLDGRRFVIAMSEAKARGKSALNEARIKAVTGGDTVTARKLFQDFNPIQLVSKLWLAFNHQPQIEDDSFGMGRRVRLIPLTYRVERPDPRLREKLKAEAPGILRWAVDGCMKYLRDGLPVPACVSLATKEYQTDSD